VITKTNARSWRTWPVVALKATGRRAPRRYLTPDLVILDDFGIREYPLAQAEDPYEIVKGRYRCGSLTLASNREPEISTSLFPTLMLAEGSARSAAQQRLRDHHARKELPLPEQRPGAPPSGASTGRCALQVANLF
jgi:hypothetical protein